MSPLRSPWIVVTVAVVGGLLLGVGLGTFWKTHSIGSVVYTALGVILLWWATSDFRKSRRGTPESEDDGSHTIE
ncbi:MAG: hypothetical protein JO040_00665 [Gemmatimonadetes bacterium]|nr:hypothetical protein [Gemmatimonadota bacterium]